MGGRTNERQQGQHADTTPLPSLATTSLKRTIVYARAHTDSFDAHAQTLTHVHLSALTTHTYECINIQTHLHTHVNSPDPADSETRSLYHETNGCSCLHTATVVKMVDPDFYLHYSFFYISHLPMFWMMIQFRAVVCVYVCVKTLT